MEWRELFKVAGVPPSALEDIQASRTLINIVTHTVEDSGVESGTPSIGSTNRDRLSTGQAVDKLDLNFLEPQATYRRLDEKSASQAWSEINVHSEQSLGSMDNSTNPYNLAIAVNSGEISAPLSVPSPPPLPPAPPPVPSINPSVVSGSTNLWSFPDELNSGVIFSQPTQKTSNGGMSLQATDLLSQKSCLKPFHERQYKMCIPEQVEPKGPYRVVASELQQQKDLLKSISVPHPNQLTDLSVVHPERLTGLADILKKVCLSCTDFYGNYHFLTQAKGKIAKE